MRKKCKLKLASHVYFVSESLEKVHKYPVNSILELYKCREKTSIINPQPPAQIHHVKLTGTIFSCAIKILNILQIITDLFMDSIMNGFVNTLYVFTWNVSVEDIVCVFFDRMRLDGWQLHILEYIHRLGKASLQRFLPQKSIELLV
jgi:hypothetical protein